MVNVVTKPCVLCENASGNPKYSGYCLYCFINTFPDNQIVCNHKTKERAVADFVRTAFPDLPWVFDRIVESGCSRRRPDIFVDMGYGVLVLEVDEFKHVNYDCTCENKRLMQLFLDAGSRPIMMVRFNPDAYTQADGQHVTSCWGVSKDKGLAHVKRTKKAEWASRLEALRGAVALHLEAAKDIESLREVTVTHLFYDGDLEAA